MLECLCNGRGPFRVDTRAIKCHCMKAAICPYGGSEQNRPYVTDFIAFNAERVQGCIVSESHRESRAPSNRDVIVIETMQANSCVVPRRCEERTLAPWSPSGLPSKPHTSALRASYMAISDAQSHDWKLSGGMNAAMLRRTSEGSLAWSDGSIG